jgi:hypothetical protein
MVPQWELWKVKQMAPVKENQSVHQKEQEITLDQVKVELIQLEPQKGVEREPEKA